MSSTESRKDELLREIEKAQIQLSSAEREASAWSKGKYKGTSQAKMAQIHVDSIRKSIATMQKELSDIRDDDT
jgi:predicted  nucleic acid-binding Zn-ribbon protein